MHNWFGSHNFLYGHNYSQENSWEGLVLDHRVLIGRMFLKYSKEI
jgi:hypothetical protein